MKIQVTKKTENLINYYNWTLLYLLGIIIVTFGSFQMGALRERYSDEVHTPYDYLSEKLSTHYDYVDKPLEKGSPLDFSYVKRVNNRKLFISKQFTHVFYISLIGLIIIDITTRYSHYYKWEYNNHVYAKEWITNIIKKIGKEP